MKTNLTLALFAALILVGWTSLAAGVIAVFAGEPKVSTHVHQHVAPEVAPAFVSDSETPCPLRVEVPDASVPCSA